MNHSCKCSCGNISITGRVLSAHEVPKQLQNGTIMVGSAKCGAFAIKKQAIDIKSKDNTNIYVSSNNVCTLTCRNCGQSIQFIENEKFAYAIFHKVTKNVRRQSTPLDYDDVKPSLLQYIKIEDEDNYNKARIEIEENGKYTEVWNWYDNYIKIELESMELVDDSDRETQDTPELTMGQSNALESARLYLETMPFSYAGLIEQLEYEGYSTEDATYATDNCGADWNEQAVKSAKSYLDLMPFSKEELISQLEYDGFTHEQAVYGVEQNGY